MQLSRYVKIFAAYNVPQSAVLFSTKRGSAIMVPSEMIGDIERGILSDEERNELVDLGFLVKSRKNEQQEMLTLIGDLNNLDRAHKYVLVLNLDCNLVCRYCFEGTRKGRFFLSEQTADRFVEFVTGRDFSKKDEIKLLFYGGEPLLSLKHIASIAERIGSFATERGLKFGFTLVTNGTLLTLPVVKRLKPLGLRGAKVTLDGPKDVHDRFRPFKSGAGTFETILRNVKDVCGEIEIQIGGNYTKDNYREFPRLLDVLAEQGITGANVSLVRFDPVMNENSEFALPDFHDGCESINEAWISEASLYLREEILRRGYRGQKIMPNACFLEFDNNLVVNYDGALYKCPGLVGREGCRAGDLEHGIADYRASHALDAWKNDECLACAYLPLCFGGCKYAKIVRTGTMQGVNCQKEYFDRVLGPLVFQDIKYEL